MVLVVPAENVSHEVSHGATLDWVDLLVHRSESNILPSGLQEITDDIYATIDRFALDLGAKLQDAFERFPDLYEDWVETCLPFGLDKARRLRMIHKAVEHLPPDVLERLPRPYRALYSVTRLPVEELTAAVESGAVHPDLTVREAFDVSRQLSGRETRRFSEADITAGRLVSFPAGSLSDEARTMLERWLNQSIAQPQPPHSSAS